MELTLTLRHKSVFLVVYIVFQQPTLQNQHSAPLMPLKICIKCTTVALMIDNRKLLKVTKKPSSINEQTVNSTSIKRSYIDCQWLLFRVTTLQAVQNPHSTISRQYYDRYVLHEDNFTDG